MHSKGLVDRLDVLTELRIRGAAEFHSRGGGQEEFDRLTDFVLLAHRFG